MFQRISRLVPMLAIAAISAGCCCGLPRYQGCNDCSRWAYGEVAYDGIDNGYSDHGTGCCGHQECGGCDTGCRQCRPLSQLFPIINWGCRPPLSGKGYACGLWGWGCGKLYMGDYISHPPACCEPCDHYGHWIGGHKHDVHHGDYPANFDDTIELAPGEMLYSSANRRANTQVRQASATRRPARTASRRVSPLRSHRLGEKQTRVH